MFTKPTVGKSVTVKLNFSDYLKFASVTARYANAISTVTGSVVDSEEFDDPSSFRIQTGNVKIPVAIIPLKNVTNLEYVDGNIAHQQEEIKPEQETESWLVQGSGTSTYTVTRTGNQWHCECKGFSFRSQCKHINTKKVDVFRKSV